MRPLTGRERRQGQGLIEFALVVPVLFFLSMAIIDFGRVLVAYAEASASVRNALRYGVILGYEGVGRNYLDCTSMHDIAGNVFFGSNTNTSVYYIDQENTALRYVCPDGSTQSSSLDAQIETGDILHIEVSTIIPLITPVFDFDLPLTISGQRTLIKQIMLPGVLGGGGGSGDCGNGVCGTGEDFANCPSDCLGACGDGFCDPSEDIGSCPADCSAICGDGSCDAGENFSTCPGDCATCGNGTCDTGEDATNCPADCSAGGVCGDSTCDTGEDFGNCPGDCPTCGNGTCDPGETAANCAIDCGPVCGNGSCDVGETSVTCPADCIPISLTIEQDKDGPTYILRLLWSGATTPNVLINRDDGVLYVMPNTGSYEDLFGSKDITHTYTVCDTPAPGVNCSNEATGITK